jgi:hypothetical protein
MSELGRGAYGVVGLNFGGAKLGSVDGDLVESSLEGGTRSRAPAASGEGTTKARVVERPRVGECSLEYAVDVNPQVRAVVGADDVVGRRR